MMLLGRGWRLDRWTGWEPAIEEPDRVMAVITYAFTKLIIRTRDGTGFCWADQLGALGSMVFGSTGPQLRLMLLTPSAGSRTPAATSWAAALVTRGNAELRVLD